MYTCTCNTCTCTCIEQCPKLIINVVTLHAHTHSRTHTYTCTCTCTCTHAHRTCTHTHTHTHRPSKTKLMGRMYKHVADLYLLCGELQHACTFFGQAINQLSRDSLWAGSANEGLGAMYMMKDRHDELSGQKSAPLSIQSNLIGFWKVSAKITGPKLSLRVSAS